ncbi:MAG: hypothetical protein MR704_15350 [Clostridia bacterium]|nr:hypothetical protein [Clostridia bacterium]
MVILLLVKAAAWSLSGTTKRHAEEGTFHQSLGKTAVRAALLESGS